MTSGLPTGIKVNEDGADGNVSFAGITSPRGELLRSPVSGTPCVHWRLRIAEQVNASLRLVHEIASIEDFDLVWSGTGSASGSGAGPVRIRVAAQTARIQATPVLHRPGSPGALATGRQFGFSGQLSVEEVALRVGEEVTAEGIIEEPPGESGEFGLSGPSGPFRGVAREIELLAATVSLPTRAALGPVLLPWALGTAAALLGGVGAATWAAWHFELVPRARDAWIAHPDEVGPYRHVRRHFSRPE